MIPKIIHQTWKTDVPPSKWIPFIEKVKKLNPEWEYILWTDADNDEFVKTNFPDFYNVFNNFSRGIMRADVIRYLIMYKIGGVYLDLDYEVLKPFEFGDHKLILPLNRSLKFGDKENTIGNCFFASIPNHKFWADVIYDLQHNTPVVSDYSQIVQATGPRLLNRIYSRNKYKDIYLPERLLYHPPSPNNQKQINTIKNNGVSLGIHHHWGSWKERWTMTYIKTKIKEMF